MENDKFAIVPFGGVFRAGELILKSFGETVRRAARKATVIRPKYQPVVGAVLLALEDIDVVIDERVTATIEQSSTGYPASRVF